MNNNMNLKPEIVSFIKFVIKELDIKTTFSIDLSEDRKKFETYAYYDKQTNKVGIYVKDRALADILRSLCHELVHHKQYELKRLEKPTPNVGIFDKNTLNVISEDVENQANAIAGAIVKKYGKTIRPDLYTL